MIGDVADFMGRLRSVMPAQWFAAAGRLQQTSRPLLIEGDGPLLIQGRGTPLLIEPGLVGTAPPTRTPILDAVLAGLASVWASLYALLQYVTAQTRIATATGVFLDFIATDFFGTDLRRLAGEQDAPFSARIRANLFLPQGTRAAMIAKLVAVTGRTPRIFEPQRAADAGGWGGAGDRTWRGLAYGVIGGYGNTIVLPGQCFITAYRPHFPGIPRAAGYASGAPTTLDVMTLTTESGDILTTENGVTLTTEGGASEAGVFVTLADSSTIGGYGDGRTRTAISPWIEYGSISAATGAWSDDIIYAAVAATEQAGVIAWTRIEN